GRLAALDEKWRTECARILPELLAQQPKLPAPGPLTEAWQRQHLVTALADEVLSSKTIILLIDDLQWCDQDTLAWLHFLLRYAERARLLLLCTVRSEETACGEHPLQAWLAQLRRGDNLTEIALGRLDAQETLDLAAHNSAQPLDPGRAAALYQETEGHPLFIVEMARSKLPLPGDSLPDKIRAVIETRLSQLSPSARELAGIAAVLGRSFTFDLLAAVS
ncbi:MAG: 6-hydroxy-D-nicotine oxidase, partial [Delftia sp.]|nr:6-hydroxy-D-nicotine oxidase [Delftia sp.]